jgi:serine/threonine-protein kinase
MAGVSVPFVRADWFVATAARPPLYHNLLGLPDTAEALEMLLKVDTEADFLRDRLARAGFVQSGVSSHNRLVDRHPALYGAYWKSYDFRRDDGTANLFRFPLGPVFAANPFPNQAFEHAGGEIIFNLPNGLQAYLLVDAKGKRIDVGPPDVVTDSLRTAGTAEVVNGLSCMSCHDQGMKRFKDTVRAGLGIAGAPGEKAERLFRDQDEMKHLLDRDEARFLKAVEEAAGPFLKVGADAAKAIRDFPDPIGDVARSYLKDLGAAQVAAELGLADPKDLLGAIRANAHLRRLGLAPLLNGATIKRTDWDSLDGRVLSTFQETARELSLGTPYRVF